MCLILKFSLAFLIQRAQKQDQIIKSTLQNVEVGRGEKFIVVCCLQGVGLSESALLCDARYAHRMDTAKAGNICAI